MVGRAPGGNGCSSSLEVTALRWLRGHSWLNSWFFRGGPPRSVGSAVTTPRQGPPSKVRRHAYGTAFLRRVLRHVPSSGYPRGSRETTTRAHSLFLPFDSCSFAMCLISLSLRVSLPLYLLLSSSPLLTFCRTFLDNLLILRDDVLDRSSLPDIPFAHSRDNVPTWCIHFNRKFAWFRAK